MTRRGSVSNICLFFLCCFYICLNQSCLLRPSTRTRFPSLVNCREEQYPCTRLYSVHKPCKQCLNSLCFYSLRRVYVINKEICMRTVCAHEELLRGESRAKLPMCPTGLQRPSLVKRATFISRNTQEMNQRSTTFNTRCLSIFK
uniref:Microfibril associated protein 2 n=1 Tax=Poecilia latipinna TaxID=48699 RepID=A0A3B3UI60_9TELE